jgi:hypothetical protein
VFDQSSVHFVFEDVPNRIAGPNMAAFIEVSSQVIDRVLPGRIPVEHFSDQRGILIRHEDRAALGVVLSVISKGNATPTYLPGTGVVYWLSPGH